MDMESIAALQTLTKQNEVIIDLLARQAIGIEEMHKVVTRGKRNPAAYVRAYNSLDGSLSVTDAAKIAAVAQPTMTSVLKGWESLGIVYNVGTVHKPAYKRLTQLPAGSLRASEGSD